MTPEQLTEEHRLIGQTAAEFIEQEVLPNTERLEQKDWALNRELVKKCGSLGLFGTNLPEEYGGVDLDKIATLVVSEQLSRYASFGTTFGAHANLAILPIFMFGTEAQKQTYLPRLVAGEIVGAYCLSESGSGSDSLGANTRAMAAGWQFHLPRREDVDHQRRLRRRLCDLRQGRRTVHRRTGVAGRVERQGRAQARLHGSSTTPVILQDVKVPADAVLRDRQGPQGRVQRAQLRPLARRDVLGRPLRDRRSREVRREPQAVRHTDRELRRHQAQDRRDDRAAVRAREHALPHGRPDRCARPRQR
jgi:hypothetical protein